MLASTNKAADLFRSVSDALTKHYQPEEAMAIARLMFDERFGVSRVNLAINQDLRLSESEIVTLHKDLQKLLKGIPIQQVIGYTRFCGLKLRVTPDVLIPRPETEELVNIAKRRLESIETPSILDAGTGSGAIAISLAVMLHGSVVTAVDLSEAALEVARNNALQNGSIVRFICDDILTGLMKITDPMDCIVSNPPYIPVSEMGEMENHVTRHEPHSALFVDDKDPVIFYRQLGLKGMEILKCNGSLMVETHFRFAGTVAELLKDIGYHSVIVHQDLFGKPRFVTAER